MPHNPKKLAQMRNKNEIEEIGPNTYHKIRGELKIKGERTPSLPNDEIGRIQAYEKRIQANLQKIKAGVPSLQECDLINKNKELQRYIAACQSKLLPEITRLKAEIKKNQEFMASMKGSQKKDWQKTVDDLQKQLDDYKKYASLKTANSDVKQKPAAKQAPKKQAHHKQKSPTKSDEKKLTAHYSRPQSTANVTMPVQPAASISFAQPVAQVSPQAAQAQPVLPVQSQPAAMPNRAATAPQPQPVNQVASSRPQVNHAQPVDRMDAFLQELNKLHNGVKNQFDAVKKGEFQYLQEMAQRFGDSFIDQSKFERNLQSKFMSQHDLAFTELGNLVQRFGFLEHSQEFYQAYEMGKQAINAAFDLSMPAGPHVQPERAPSFAAVQQPQQPTFAAQPQPAAMPNRAAAAPQPQSQPVNQAAASRPQADHAQPVDRMDAFLRELNKLHAGEKNQFDAAKKRAFENLQERAQTYGSSVDQGTFEHKLQPRLVSQRRQAFTELEILVQHFGFRAGTPEYHQAHEMGKQAINTAFDLSMPVRPNNAQPARPQANALAQQVHNANNAEFKHEIDVEERNSYRP